MQPCGQAVRRTSRSRCSVRTHDEAVAFDGFASQCERVRAQSGWRPEVEVLALAVFHKERLQHVARIARIELGHGRVQLEHAVDEAALFGRVVGVLHRAAQPAGAEVGRLTHDRHDSACA